MAHIWLIERDDTLRQILQELYEYEGLSVLTRGSLSDAYAHVACDPPSIVVADVDRAHSAGEVESDAEHLRRLARVLPVLLLGSDECAPARGAIGGCHVLERAFDDIDALLRTTRPLMAASPGTPPVVGGTF